MQSPGCGPLRTASGDPPAQYNLRHSEPQNRAGSTPLAPRTCVTVARRPRRTRSRGVGQMHVVVNEKLVKTRVRFASIAHIAALAVFAIGLLISWTNPQPTWEEMAAAYAAIIVGLVLYNVGQVFLRRFGPRVRQEGVLARTLKGLDRRYTLLAFPSTKLPDYILVGPSGVQVIVPRPHDGNIACRANRWSRDAGAGLKRLGGLFGGASFRDPSADVARGIERVRRRLQERGLAAHE